FKPISTISSDQYQRVSFTGGHSLLVDFQFKNEQWSWRNEIGLGIQARPFDHVLAPEAYVSSQLFWQRNPNGLRWGSGLSFALYDFYGPETSVFFYRKSPYELRIPLLVEKHWSLGAKTSLNIGVMTRMSLTRTFRDCYWLEESTSLETTPCHQQLIRSGWLYAGLLYRLR
ncbi:MAG: hypothetical protein AAFQ68_28840, partial [Bacteroidota bacterium]